MKTFFSNFLIGFIFTLFVLFIGIPAICLDDTAGEPITFDTIRELYQGE